MEDGLRANGVRCVTVTTPWFSQIRRIVGREKFDQVWLDIVQPLDESWLEWLTGLAPVLVGRLGESLDYSGDEEEVWPVLKGRKAQVEKQLRYATHVLACDEKDVDEISARRLPAMWWPQAVPSRFVTRHAPSPLQEHAVFYGMRYGARGTWLAHEALQGLLASPRPPESTTIYPLLFNALHLPFLGPLPAAWPAKRQVLSLYLSCLRSIRRATFSRFLRGLQEGSAVVNLPHFVKTYAGRVIEGMAAGRAVISWEIPNRPRNLNLFANDKEILLYHKNQPEQLAAQLRRVFSDKTFARRLEENATRKVLAFHTSEIRVRQILNWIETGQEPDYG
jgi:hypothetical protein